MMELTDEKHKLADRVAAAVKAATEEISEKNALKLMQLLAFYFQTAKDYPDDAGRNAILYASISSGSVAAMACGNKQLANALQLIVKSIADVE